MQRSNAAPLSKWRRRLRRSDWSRCSLPHPADAAGWTSFAELSAWGGSLSHDERMRTARVLHDWREATKGRERFDGGEGSVGEEDAVAATAASARSERADVSTPRSTTGPVSKSEGVELMAPRSV